MYNIGSGSDDTAGLSDWFVGNDLKTKMKKSAHKVVVMTG